jgi:hypothetical protein
MRRKNEGPPPEYIEGEGYNNRELGEMADALLREDARSEVCRACNERGGQTGSIEHTTQDAEDAEGNALVLDFPEYECVNGHKRGADSRNWRRQSDPLRGTPSVA